MKSLKHYIKLVEEINDPSPGWIANLMVYYEFPDNPMIPQRAKQIESAIDDILKKYEFYMTGGGGGVGARDVSYSFEGPGLAEVLKVAQQAQAEIQQFANRIEANNAAMGIEGLEISVGGWIMDSDYEHNFSFDEAEDIVRQSQQLGRQ